MGLVDLREPDFPLGPELLQLGAGQHPGDGLPGEGHEGAAGELAVVHEPLHGVVRQGEAGVALQGGDDLGGGDGGGAATGGAGAGSAAGGALVAVVVEQQENLLTPPVRLVFDADRGRRLAPQDLDLARGNDRIECYEDPEPWGIVPKDYL